MKYVDTTRMAALLNIIEANVKEIKTAIDSYSATAPSLGESSFLGTVEGNLNKIKNIYSTNLTPPLDLILENIDSVRSQYDLGSSKIEGASM